MAKIRLSSEPRQDGAVARQNRKKNFSKSERDAIDARIIARRRQRSQNAINESVRTSKPAPEPAKNPEKVSVSGNANGRNPTASKTAAPPHQTPSTLPASVKKIGVGKSKQPIGANERARTNRLVTSKGESLRREQISKENRINRLFDRKSRGKSAQERSDIETQRNRALNASRNQFARRQNVKASASDRITQNRVNAIKAGKDPSARIDPSVLAEKARIARRLGDVIAQADALRPQPPTAAESAANFRAQNDTIGGLTVEQTNALKQFATPITATSVGNQQNTDAINLAKKTLNDPASQIGGQTPTESSALDRIRSGGFDQFAPGQFGGLDTGQVVNQLAQAPHPPQTTRERLAMLEAQAARLRSQVNLSGSQFASPAQKDQALAAANANPQQPSITGLAAQQDVTQRRQAEDIQRQTIKAEAERVLAEARARSAAAVASGGGLRKNESIDVQQRNLSERDQQRTIDFVSATGDFGLPQTMDGAVELGNRVNQGVQTALDDATSITRGIAGVFGDVLSSKRDKFDAFSKNLIRQPISESRKAIIREFVKKWRATGKSLSDIPAAVGPESGLGAGKTHRALARILSAADSIDALSAP